MKYSNVRAVSGIYNRHQDEFTDSMSLVLKLNTNGINNSLRKKSVRVFSLRGAHLVGMMSDTPVAKEFRRWVLDILDSEAGKPTMHSPATQAEAVAYNIHTLSLTEEELCSLCWLWKVADNMRKGAEMLYPGLKQLSSQYSGECHDMAFESRHTLRNVKEILQRETKNIDPSAYRWRYIIPQIRQIN
ncbi:hypothetical protein LU632_07030 [Erwinia tracheiphila]|uniref:P22AR C-terminal domain-containing protein n=1 Tax=Erwinia tracheiphila TaxID=65700 RepID=UPI001F1B79B5|nr:P22AR C-terminal domain-containing protein [Erwinia tracheiphila]UIA93284.1 hypothetical protein LU632_07030 [Erwinia tracheiphila]